MTFGIPLVLKFADWPAQDQRLWRRCLERGRLFDAGGGAFAAWSEGTRRLHAQSYGSWLSHILRCRPQLLDTAPAARVTQETVTAFIEEGRERLKLRSISNQLLSLAVVIRGFSPDADIAWLWRAAGNLYRQSEPQKLKPPSPISAQDLFGWSVNRLSLLRTEANPDQAVATEFRQALTVGLLISCPVRVRAFVAMTVGGHVDVADGNITFNFFPKDMKDKKARRLPAPEPLVSFLFEYLKVYRPLLLGGVESEALWISNRGRPLSQDSFSSGLALLTKRHFGVALRPHAFRHIAATSIATADPAHAGIIRDVLGHASVRMAEMHYNRATAVEVSKRLQEVLRKRRGAHRHRKRRKALEVDVDS